MNFKKHIKTILFALLVIFFTQMLSAQDGKFDTIYTIDDKAIVAKVTEIGEEFVIYQDPNLEGVDLSIKIGRIDRIVKSNGELITIREAAEELAGPEMKFKNPKDGSEKIGGRSYWLVAGLNNVDSKDDIKLKINGKKVNAVDFVFENDLLKVATDQLKKGENSITIMVDYFGDDISRSTYFAYENKSGGAIRIGLKAGAIFNNYNFLVDGEKANGNVDGKIGLVAGLQIEKVMSSSFSLRLESLYTQRGYSSSIYDADLSANYLEVALLGVVRFSASAKISPFVSVGPSASFMIGSGSAMVNGTEVEVTFQKKDFGLSAGFGVYVNGNILIEARYVHGLTNIESARDAELVGEETLTRNFVVGLGYFF